MAIDAKHLTMQALTSKDAALSRATTALKNLMTGNFTHDAPILQQLAAINAEQAHIASRLAAIAQGQPFTAPKDSEVNSLGSAISTLDQDIKANSVLNTISTDVTNVLNQYGARSSQ